MLRATALSKRELSGVEAIPLNSLDEKAVRPSEFVSKMRDVQFKTPKTHRPEFRNRLRARAMRFVQGGLNKL